MNTATDSSYHHRPDRPVWMLIGAGVAMVAITLATFGYFLYLQRTVHARAERLSSLADCARSSLIAQAEDAIAAANKSLLHHSPPANCSQRPDLPVAEIPELDPGAARSMNDLLATANCMLQQVRDFDKECESWQARNALLATVLEQRELEINTQLEAARAACRSADGKQRLERVATLRRIRAKEPADTADTALALLSSTLLNANHASIQTELTDLQLLCGRLARASTASAAEDLASNQIRPLLERLGKLCGTPADSPTPPVTPELCHHIESLILPQSEPRATGPQDHPSSLKELVAIGLQLDAEHNELEERLVGWNRDMDTVVHHVTTATESFACEALSRTRSAAARTWMSLSIVGGVALLVFLTLGHRVARQVRTDVAQITSANHELTLATARANAANRAKSDFLANMSHEIRTPMTAIIGFSDMLRDPQLNPSERDRCLRTISANGQQLMSTINDILDITSMEAGTLQIEPCATDPRSLVIDALQPAREMAIAKNLAFEIHLDPELPSSVLIDPSRLRQIITHLTGNSVKFTESGGVRLSVRTENADAADQCFLVVEVSDTGIGIAPAQIAAIFKPFSQADGTMSRRFGGVGLGLAICKRVADMMHGTLEVSSQPGRGSRFTARLLVTVLSRSSGPAAAEAVDPIAQVTVPALPLTHRRVLLVEDGLDNQRLISMLLRKSGAEVCLAANGRLAIDMIDAELAAGRSFDIVYMDMQMPEMDGYQAATELKSRGFTTPIIALTAHAMQEDRAKCIAAGCDDYMTKPVTKSALVTMAGKWLRAGSSTTQGAAT